MQAARFEGSLLTSLKELKSIEQQRIADERAAVTREHELRIEVQAAAERARVEAAEAKQRAEHEQHLAVERARADAEREARLRVEAAEAAERERQAAALAEARAAQELELRRAEVAKKRPTWMIALTAFALVATGVLIYVTINSMSASDAADQARVEAERKAEIAKLESEQARVQLDRLEADMRALDVRVNAAIQRVADATTQAEAKSAADQLKRDREKQREAAIAADKLRRELELKKRLEEVKIDASCKNNPLCRKPGK